MAAVRQFKKSLEILLCFFDPFVSTVLLYSFTFVKGHHLWPMDLVPGWLSITWIYEALRTPEVLQHIYLRFQMLEYLKGVCSNKINIGQSIGGKVPGASVVTPPLCVVFIGSCPCDSSVTTMQYYQTFHKFLTMSTEFDKNSSKWSYYSTDHKNYIKFFLNIFRRSY